MRSAVGTGVGDMSENPLHTAQLNTAPTFQKTRQQLKITRHITSTRTREGKQHDKLKKVSSRASNSKKSSISHPIRRFQRQSFAQPDRESPKNISALVKFLH